MNKLLKKVILLIFVFSLLSFVSVANADTTGFDLASNNQIATYSNAVQNVNEAAAVFVKPDMWYRTNSGLWYYFENNWSTTRTGWFVDPNDGQTYYLRPENGIMAVGWTKIGDDEYYFNDNKDDESAWFEVGGGFYAKWLNGQQSYGSLYKDCMTPDGKMVDKDGKLIK